MDDVAWGALALSLMVAGGIYTWFAFRRRGLAAGLRGAGLTLVPLALWLTDTLELLSDIAGSVVDWAGDLVFSPATWVGLLAGAVAAVLLVVSGFLRRRQAEEAPSTSPRQLGATGSPGKAPVVADPIDAEMAEIEALLRKRGIT